MGQLPYGFPQAWPARAQACSTRAAAGLADDTRVGWPRARLRHREPARRACAQRARPPTPGGRRRARRRPGSLRRPFPPHTRVRESGRPVGRPALSDADTNTEDGGRTGRRRGEHAGAGPTHVERASLAEALPVEQLGWTAATSDPHRAGELTSVGQIQPSWLNCGKPWCQIPHTTSRSNASEYAPATGRSRRRSA